MSCTHKKSVGGLKQMSKYNALWMWIEANQKEDFKMTFSEIESITGFPIDHSFLTYKKELLDLGYHVKKISMKDQFVAFERKCELITNIDKLHTTKLGVDRIKKNLSLETDDVVEWCKTKILSRHARMTRNGKNWYVDIDNCILTVNSYSYTIITAHKK